MIGAVENAMLARIKSASDHGAIPYAYRTLETWPKRFDEYLSSRMVAYPAAWAAFGGAHKVDIVSRGRWRAHCSFGLVVAAENVRNEEATRHGGSDAEPGSYQLAIDAARLLSSQSLGLDMDALEPTSILPVETSDIPKVKQLSIYAVSFETALYFDAMPDVGGAPDAAAFRIFHANWDPAPYGHVDADPAAPGVQIPDDAHAVATDHITLPQDLS